MGEPAAEPCQQTRVLPALLLEGGAMIASHRVSTWMWSTENDTQDFAAGKKLAHKPTVLFVHPLTTGAPVAGPNGYWDFLCGKGRYFRPWAQRLLGINLIGSCFGSSGPADDDFPRRDADSRFEPPIALVRGGQTFAESGLPCTVTPWDQARSILMMLDDLGIDRVNCAVGGSIGGMVVQCLASLAPERFAKVVSIAAPLAAGASMIGWNHVAREAILRDTSYPIAKTGLSIARQFARMTYRGDAVLEERQGRQTAGPRHEGCGAWNPRMPYRVATYLRHQGDKFAESFDARSYVCLTLAMDHHDLARKNPQTSMGDVKFYGISIDSDTLVPPKHVASLVRFIQERGAKSEHLSLSSPYGHDAFLVESSLLAKLFNSIEI